MSTLEPLQKGRRVVVVGGGSAGCVVAEVLSRSGTHRVTLLEAGPDRDPGDADDPTTGTELFRALAVEQRQWPVLLATAGLDGPQRVYLRGRGIGGSGAINGMLLQPGPEADYDRWAALPGCAGWSWRELRPFVDAALRSGSVTAAMPPGPADEMLRDAASSATGWQLEAAVVSQRDGRRVASDLTHLAAARQRSKLQVRTHADVVRILLDGRRAAGVELTSGEVVEADVVVVCAGAFGSPILLARSGLDRPGIGANLHDHPGFTIAFDAPGTTGGPLTTVIARSADRDRQLIALNRTAADGPSAPAWICATLLQHGRGRVDVDRHTGEARVHAGVLDDERDRAELRTTGRAASSMAASTPWRSPGLPDAGDDDATWDRWLEGQLGAWFHAAGTCRMGDVTDDLAVVDEHCSVIGTDGLSVIDASIYPEQPRANPYATTVAVAELTALRLAARLDA